MRPSRATPTKPGLLPRQVRKNACVVLLVMAMTLAVLAEVALAGGAGCGGQRCDSLGASPRRHLHATLEGSVGFNLGRASTTANFKRVPKKAKTETTAAAAGGPPPAVAASGGSAASCSGDGSGGGGSPLHTIDLTRAEALKVGRELVEAGQAGGWEGVVVVQIGGGGAAEGVAVRVAA